MPGEQKPHLLGPRSLQVRKWTIIKVPRYQAKRVRMVAFANLILKTINFLGGLSLWRVSTITIVKLITILSIRMTRT